MLDHRSHQITSFDSFWGRCATAAEFGVEEWQVVQGSCALASIADLWLHSHSSGTGSQRWIGGCLEHFKHSGNCQHLGLEDLGRFRNCWHFVQFACIFMRARTGKNSVRISWGPKQCHQRIRYKHDAMPPKSINAQRRCLLPGNEQESHGWILAFKIQRDTQLEPRSAQEGSTRCGRRCYGATCYAQGGRLPKESWWLAVTAVSEQICCETGGNPSGDWQESAEDWNFHVFPKIETLYCPRGFTKFTINGP